MVDYRAIADAVKMGAAPKVKKMVSEAIENGATPADILNNSLCVGMSEIGVLFKNNEVYVPEVLIAARAMKAGMGVIKPLLIAENVEMKGKVAIGTVKGDLHDIGKNLVAMMLEGAGFQVIDLGTDVPPEQYVSAITEQGAQIIGMSALLTTTMPVMKDTIDAITAAGLRDKVKIMIGGAPVTDIYANEIGADGYTSDAASAAEMALKLVKEL